MKARNLLLTASALLGLAACLTLGTASAHAQAHPTASGPGSYLTAGGGVSIFESDYGQRYIGGGFAYVDSNPTWRYGIEAEGRWLRYNTDESVTETNYFIGPKIAILMPHTFNPYAKFLVGAGQITLPFGYGNGTFFAMVPGGGLDIALTDRLTLRAPDVEYQVWPNFASYGALHPYGVSVGLSFRINGISPYPKHGSRASKH